MHGWELQQKLVEERHAVNLRNRLVTYSEAMKQSSEPRFPLL